MVAVFVGDQDGGQVFRRPAQGGQALTNLARGKSSVDQNAGFARLQVGTIASGPATEDGEMNGHAQTLGRPKMRGKLFQGSAARFAN